MSGEGRARSARPIPLLLLLLVLLTTVGPATAQTDLSGKYEADLTFDDVSPPCINPGYEDPLNDWEMTVLMRGTSNVDITFVNIPSIGNDTVFNASLNADLNAYAEHENGWTITGQFTVTGSEVYFGGNVQWTNECQTDPTDPSQRVPVPQRFGVQAERVSGGEAVVPSPSPPTASGTFPRALPGASLASEAWHSVCDPTEERPSSPKYCGEAINYGSDWGSAMDADNVRLQLDPRSDAHSELRQLQNVIHWAAMLGGILVDTPGGRFSRFPVVHALLPVFAALFVQGVSLAGTGQIDSLRTTVAQANDLLFAAVSQETRTGQA